MAAITQRSFAGGEIGSSLKARVDQARYFISANRIRNMVVMRHGGAQGRPGTRWVAEVKDSTKAVRLIEFVFNSSQTYILEFGDQYIRVHKNGVPVLAGSPVAVTSITKANPAVVTATAHGFNNGDEVCFGSLWPAFYEYVPGMPEVQNRQFIVANKTANTFELKTKGNVNVDSTGYGTYTGSGATVSKIYEITSPYTESQLADIGFTQSADTLFLTHPSHAPRRLTRSADNNWALNTLTFAASISAPSAAYGPAGPSTGNCAAWKITAVNEAGEESLPVQWGPVRAIPTAATPLEVGWNAVTGAVEYNIYRLESTTPDSPGAEGLVGISTNLRFLDYGITPDYSQQAPQARNPFSGSNLYPATVGLFQQRLAFGFSNSFPQNVWLSRIGSLYNFDYRRVLEDSDAVIFSILGAQEVRHLFDLGKLIVMTRNGSWVCQGSDGSGAVTPSSPFPVKTSSYPVSKVRPVVVDGSLVYVQTGFPSMIRDLLFEFESQGYRGSDLTVFAPHLFKDFAPVALAYQERPHSIVWAARSDGLLCGLTYVREQQIIAWHHHLFSQLMPLAAATMPSTAVYPAGLVKSICVVPEDGDSGQDFLYLVVQRHNYSEGRTIQYIERVPYRYVTSADQRPLEADYYTGPDYQILPLFPDSVKDACFVDSGHTYDGRNHLTYSSEPNYTGGSSLLSTKTMTLSGGSAWDETETLTLTASAATFKSTDVGQVEIHLLDRSGKDTYYRLKIEAYTSATVVTVRVKNGTVPTGLRGVATTQWAKAVKTVYGLWHLEGSEVSVLGDGNVVASPFNRRYETVRVTNGQITLNECYAVIQVGLPYTQELETLDLDTPQGPGLADEAKNVERVRVYIEDTKGFFVGIRGGELEEAPVRNDFDRYDDPAALGNGWVDVKIKSEWNSNGRIVIRQIDPLPLTVLAVRPKGNFGRGG